MKRIRKTYNGVVPNGKILNSYSTSQNDGYSCNYINGIIESGRSGNNDYYIKFIDGTLIQYSNVTIPANSVNVTITFVIPFVNTNYRIVLQNAYANSSDVVYSFASKTTENIKVYPRINGSTPTVSTIADWIAIGKWK